MLHDRETTAQRLLQGSVRRWYDPSVDIDWDAPLVDGAFFTPPSMVTLYGTPLWEELSQEQRVELSRQEMVNTVSVGIWFENILNQMLLRLTYKQDPTRPHVHYALTELADECRHMTMFGRLIDRVGAPARTGRGSRCTTWASYYPSCCAAHRCGWPRWSARRSSTRCSGPPCTTSRSNRWCDR